MKTWQLVFIRIYMTTFGRLAFFALILRKFLELHLIKHRKPGAYHASCSFFDIRELE